MNSPNILINNFCNQGCTYCFAEELMRDKKIPREMSIEDFKALIKKLKKSKNKFDTVKLLGGEPTLHSKFKDIVKITMDNFNYVQIFTNGLFSEDIFYFLKKHPSKIRFTFNISTPTFLFNPKKKLEIVGKIIDLSSSSENALSVTIDPQKDINIILNSLSEKLLRKTKYFRLGIANPIFQQNNRYSWVQFKQTGKKMVYFIKKIKELNKKTEISLNCGFVRCMFSISDLKNLQKMGVVLLGWGCHGKTSEFDIKTNLNGILCYPLANAKTADLKKGGLEKARKNLYSYLALCQDRWSLDVCRQCRYFGPKNDQCPGPCIAYKEQLDTHSSKR